MKYLNEADLQTLGVNWDETIGVIDAALSSLADGDYAQPIKPYLRYRNLKNRIIAMPAFVGGKINTAGIKWIASFPDNIHAGIPRANCAVILNDADTGEIKSIINTGLISSIRTASVSGWMLKKYLEFRQPEKVNLGIIGWGPIGRQHFQMATHILGERLNQIYLYDLHDIDKQTAAYPDKDRITIADGWQEVYKNSDIFITCTVSAASYIEGKPRAGALYLNVSLRDFKVSIYDFFKDNTIVDDWEEICRERTDIENLHLEKGLQKEQTKSIVDIWKEGLKPVPADAPLFFNPMGMAVFDIAIGYYYYKSAAEKNRGVDL